MYDPKTIVFLSPDPLEEAGGSPNLYLYCANDPINQVDPSGKRALARQDRNLPVGDVLGADLSAAFGVERFTIRQSDQRAETTYDNCDLYPLCLFDIPVKVWQMATSSLMVPAPVEVGLFPADYKTVGWWARMLSNVVEHDAYVLYGPHGAPTTSWITASGENLKRFQNPCKGSACIPRPCDNATLTQPNPGSLAGPTDIWDVSWNALGDAYGTAKMAFMKSMLSVPFRPEGFDEMALKMDNVFGKSTGRMVNKLVVGGQGAVYAASCSIIDGLKAFCNCNEATLEACEQNKAAPRASNGCEKLAEKLLKQFGRLIHVDGLERLLNNDADAYVNTALSVLGLDWASLIGAAVEAISGEGGSPKDDFVISLATALAGGVNSNRDLNNGSITEWINKLFKMPGELFEGADEIIQEVQNFQLDKIMNKELMDTLPPLIAEFAAGIAVEIGLKMGLRAVPILGWVVGAYGIVDMLSKMQDDEYKDVAPRITEVIEAAIDGNCKAGASKLYSLLNGPEGAKAIQLLLTGLGLGSVVTRLQRLVDKLRMKVRMALVSLMRKLLKPIKSAVAKFQKNEKVNPKGGTSLTPPVKLKVNKSRKAWIGTGSMGGQLMGKQLFVTQSPGHPQRRTPKVNAVLSKHDALPKTSKNASGLQEGAQLQRAVAGHVPEDEDLCQKTWGIKPMSNPIYKLNDVKIPVEEGKVPRSGDDTILFEKIGNQWYGKYQVVEIMIFRSKAPMSTDVGFGIGKGAEPTPSAKRFALKVAGGQKSGHIINETHFSGPGTIKIPGDDKSFPNIVPLTNKGNNRQIPLDRMLAEYFRNSLVTCAKFEFSYDRKEPWWPVSFKIFVLYKDKLGDWTGDPLLVGTVKNDL